MTGVLGSVVDGVKSGTLVTMDNTLTGNVPEEVLIPNAESDFTFNSSTGTITGYKGTRTDVVIPSTIGGISVKVIGDTSFQKKGLTSVYIPDGVTHIGVRAFECFSSISYLTDVRLPKTLISIGDWAFYGNLLTSIDLPDSLTSIGYYSFSTNNLTNLELPDNLTSLGSYAFNNNKLKTVRVPDGITEIQFGTFNKNPLESIELVTGTTYYLMVSPVDAKSFPDTTVVNFY